MQQISQSPLSLCYPFVRPDGRIFYYFTLAMIQLYNYTIRAIGQARALARRQQSHIPSNCAAGSGVRMQRRIDTASCTLEQHHRDICGHRECGLLETTITTFLPEQVRCDRRTTSRCQLEDDSKYSTVLCAPRAPTLSKNSVYKILANRKSNAHSTASASTKKEYSQPLPCTTAPHKSTFPGYA